MKSSLYLTDYEKETIKNDLFYKLRFFDNINGLVYITYIEKNSLYKNYINLIDNGNKKIIERLKKELIK